MKRLEDYVDAARSFNAGIKGDSTLAVVEKLGKDDTAIWDQVSHKKDKVKIGKKKVN